MAMLTVALACASWFIIGGPATENSRLCAATSGPSAIVDLIVSFGRKRAVAIIAEGVETADQAESLAGIGCSFGQGYRFARPERAEVAERSLAT